MAARRRRSTPPQRLVGGDRQQRGQHGAGHDLLAEILGDALEDDVAEPAGIDVGGDGGDRDLRDHGDADAGDDDGQRQRQLDPHSLPALP